MVIHRLSRGRTTLDLSGAEYPSEMISHPCCYKKKLTEGRCCGEFDCGDVGGRGRAGVSGIILGTGRYFSYQSSGKYWSRLLSTQLSEEPTNSQCACISWQKDHRDRTKDSAFRWPNGTAGRDWGSNCSCDESRQSSDSQFRVRPEWKKKPTLRFRSEGIERFARFWRQKDGRQGM